MNLKNGKALTSKFVENAPSSYGKKNNLPVRGLTKVEKRWSTQSRTCIEGRIS
jgi:hypothetical protein